MRNSLIINVPTIFHQYSGYGCGRAYWRGDFEFWWVWGPERDEKDNLSQFILMLRYV